jgi:predicted transcriptional regulator
MSTKEILLEVAAKLPADATMTDAIYELEFRQAVEEGLASLDRGERVSLEEAPQQIPSWISAHSEGSLAHVGAPPSFAPERLPVLPTPRGIEDRRGLSRAGCAHFVG